MNKLTKIGASALCGSLAAISAANAGDLAVTGSAHVTYVSEGGATTGNPIGMQSNLGFSGSGELENGWTVDLSIAYGDGANYSTASVTVGLPGLGDIRIDQGVSGTGIQRMDDMTPSVWEEADGAGLSAGINKIAGTSVGGTIEVVPTDAMPAGLTARIAWSPDSDSGRTGDKAAGGSSGVLGAGWDITLEAGSDLHGVDGLSIYGGYSQVDQQQNGSAYNGDVKENVLGIKYAAGAFSVGAQVTDEDTGATAATGYDNIAYGVTFNVNDDLSIGINHTESDQKGSTNPTAEATSIQAAYTMGGATFRIAEVQVDNSTYSSSDQSATILSLGLAF